MAWSETTILNRAKEMARTYCDEDRITTTDVRAVVQAFCLDSRAIYGSETITTVSGQRVYDLQRVFEIVRVRRGATTLPHGYQDNTDSYQVRPSQLVLNYNPPANQSIVVEGYLVPANVSDINLQPEVMWMDAMAHLVAARVLNRYGDNQAIARSQVFQQAGESLVSDLLKRLVQPFAPRPATDQWNLAYMVHKAREMLHPFGLASLATDSECLAAAREFLLKARAYYAETQHQTVANQKRYSLGEVALPTEVVYDSAPIPMRVDAPYSQSWYVQQGELVLNFEPAAGKDLIVRGYGVPTHLSSVRLEPADRWMDAIACKVVADTLMKRGTDKDSAVRAQYLMSLYANALNDLTSQMQYSRLQRHPSTFSSRRLSLV